MPEMLGFETPVSTSIAHGRARHALRGTRLPAVVSRALLSSAHLQTARWDFATKHVAGAQLRVLREIIGRAARTQFGCEHGFDGIRTYEQFAARVAVSDYDSFAPYIARMREGEAGLLVPERVRYFANSSGSSRQGRSKFLPITERQIAQQRLAGSETLARYLVHARERAFLSGYTLGLFPPTTMRPEGKALITSNPALMVTHLPRFTRPFYLPEEDIKRMADYDAKLSAIAERYLDYDVRAVTGTTCWFPLLFEKVLQAAAARGRPASCVRDIWPELRVLLGGGVSSTPYLPMLRKLIGQDVTLVDSYNATEGGIYAASDHSGAPGLLMLPHRGTFFEFVPVDRGAGSQQRVPLWAVERDRDYSIVVTTLSGLYAYELGDIVRFVSTKPPRIQFAGRLLGCLSLTQELTTHVEIERAVTGALAAHGGRTVEYGAAADVDVAGSKSRYVLYVEFDKGGEPADLTAFAAAFDAELCSQNRVYREHRTGEVALLPARVVNLPRGASKRFLERTTAGNLQGKFPRILDANRQRQLQEQLSISSD